MIPIPLNIPVVGAEISNYLYPEMDLDDLGQDIITVRLPNGFYIDVGWYPECNPNGQYVVRVFRESWENQQLPTPFTTQDPNQVVSAVETLADTFSKPQVMLSRAGRSSVVKV